MVMVNSIECFPWQKWSQHLFKCSGESWGSQQGCEGALMHPQLGRAIPSHGSGAWCQGRSEGRAMVSGIAPSGAVGGHKRQQGWPLIILVVFHIASCCVLVQLEEVH